MKANLHWIKKLLQVSFVPAEIRPGKSRPEIYIYIYGTPPKKKPTSLHVFLVFAPMSWKKIKNLEKTKKQYSRTLAKAKIQKTSRKPKKQKNQKKTIFQDSCKSKNAKIQKTSRKPKKTKKTKKKKQYSRSLEIGPTGKSPGILIFLFFLVFLVFSRFFGFLHFYFCKSPGILFFLIFLVFFCFLEVFWIFAFARVLEYVFLLFVVFSRIFSFYLFFFKFFVLEIWARV